MIVLERREMGLTRADFQRVFPRLVAGIRCSLEGDVARVRWPDGARLEVRLSPERRRRIAGLSLPCMDLRFEFQGLTRAACEAFMTRFDRAFHKGGG